MNKIAVILLRGKVNVDHQRKKTMEYLRLGRKNACVVLNNTPENIGMLIKIKDYVTYGEVDEKILKELIEKRGELVGQTKVKDEKNFKTDEIVEKYFKNEIKLRDFELTYKLKPYFRLNPPIKGFERKGIKMPFGKGGALGNRADKMKDLILKML
jgi:large subunit ribosomal protein L30